MLKVVGLWLAAICLLSCPISSVGAESIERVRFVTDSNIKEGVIEFELYPDRAPITVANFLRYLDAGYYRNSSFYRVVRMDNQPNNEVRIEVIQGGMGVGAYDSEIAPVFSPIAHETTKMSGLSHVDGALSMARLAPGSATSEFFICVNDQPSLDFGGGRNPDGQGFAVFGRVTRGMDVVRDIQAGSTDAPVPGYLQGISGQRLDHPVTIKKVERF